MFETLCVSAEDSQFGTLSEDLPDLRSVVIGQCKILSGRDYQGVPLTADSLMRLAVVAERLAAIEEGRA